MKYETPKVLPKEEWFRKPDVKVSDTYALWYGPAGKEGDCATEVKSEGTRWRVTAYDDCTGLLDDLDPYTPILATSVTVKARNVREAAAIACLHEIPYRGGEEHFTAGIPQG